MADAVANRVIRPVGVDPHEPRAGREDWEEEEDAKVVRFRVRSESRLSLPGSCLPGVRGLSPSSRRRHAARESVGESPKMIQLLFTIQTEVFCDSQVR